MAHGLIAPGRQISALSISWFKGLVFQEIAVPWRLKVTTTIIGISPVDNGWITTVSKNIQLTFWALARHQRCKKEDWTLETHALTLCFLIFSIDLVKRRNAIRKRFEIHRMRTCCRWSFLRTSSVLVDQRVKFVVKKVSAMTHQQVDGFCFLLKWFVVQKWVVSVSITRNFETCVMSSFQNYSEITRCQYYYF